MHIAEPVTRYVIDEGRLVFSRPIAKDIVSTIHDVISMERY